MTEQVETVTKEVIDRLREVDFCGAVRLHGYAAGGVRHRWNSLSAAIEDREKTALLVDGASGGESGGVLYEVLSDWTRAHCRGGEETGVMRLFDYLTMAMDIGTERMETDDRGRLIVDAVVRLVEVLVERRPAVVTVVEPERLTDIEKQVLRSVMQHFLALPLQGVDPELSDKPDVGFIWVGDDPGWPKIDFDVVELTEHRAGEVRQFLDDERIIERLMEATSGDPRQLEVLFDGLPSTVSQLWARRITDLTPDEQRMTEYLAVADAPLDVGFIAELVDAPVVPLIRTLSDRGVVRRRMDGGVVEVELTSSAIRDGVVGRLDDETRRQLHRMLAGVAEQTRDRQPRFVARHALAGGDEQRGVVNGLPAARQLLRRGRWEAADAMLSKLGELSTPTDDERRQILELTLRLAEGRGAWREALPVVDRLREMREAPLELAGLDRRAGRYLTKLGRLESALRHFEQALERLDGEGVGSNCDERARVLLGLAETAYRRGEHEESRDRALEAIEHLAAVDDASIDERLHIECAAILGRVALYRGELEAARRHFEKKAAEARRLGEAADESCAEVDLGVVAIQQGRYEEANRRLERALEHSELPGGAPRLNCWLNLGIVRQRRGDFAEALDYYHRSLREAMRRGDEAAREIATLNLTTIYQDMGAFDEGRRLIEDYRDTVEAARHRSTVQETADGRGSDRAEQFVAAWTSRVQGQMLLEEGRPRPALEQLRRARREIADDRRLYREKVRIACAKAHLDLGEDARARELIASIDDDSTNPHIQPLSRFYEAVLARRAGDPPDETTWRTVISDLEALGLYHAATEARLELAGVLAGETSEGEASALVVERGIEDLRQRAEAVPERFRDAFFSIPVNRRLVEEFEDHRGGDLPPDLDRRFRPTPNDVAPDSSANVDEEKRNAGATDVDRSDPDYRRWRARYSEMIGEAPSMLQVFRHIDRVAPGETTVLLSGESGTGKELAAEAIHRHSPRSHGPFVKVNCAAFVEELLLSELFGHEKGAFTGAVDNRIGCFERADGGTIFLDEIGDISPKTQVSLLRVLQEGAFETVGGSETKTVDVRVLAATNRDLEEMVRQGEFRLDLYYRLKGFLIEMPSLGERRGDIPLLLDHFAREFSSEPVPTFSEEAVQFLARYRWPGNVRELENFVRSVLLFVEEETVEMQHLVEFREFFGDDDVDESLPDIDAEIPEVPVTEFDGPTAWSDAGDTEEALAEEVVADERSLSRLKKRLEHKCIERALRQTGGNITQAARILQMKRPRLSQIVNGDDELLALKKELVG